MAHCDLDLLALGERVRKLEVQNHRWKLSTVVLALVLASSLTMAMGPWEASRKSSTLRVKSIQTENLELRDTDGHVGARLTMQNQQPSLVLYNRNGKVMWKAPGPLMVNAR